MNQAIFERSGKIELKATVAFNLPVQKQIYFNSVTIKKFGSNVLVVFDVPSPRC